MTSYKRTFVPQIDARDCGVAALASIAKFYGSDFSLAHLRELAKTNKEGTTALGIVKPLMKWALKQGLFKQIKLSLT